ncbi:reducing type I polyketide synthase [Xylaria bambusicola]|uniref:reducing type I polyketide synthase n=1 Tax=Xylaria bambusicola TaxID=326684 RepID=UPI0020086A57|nr:reducing type I polyketide synthase [Xylaria bambusicola]KAI0502950.1 reducing type I polyketide synthase [Xylaria bambusicola]
MALHVNGDHTGALPNGRVNGDIKTLLATTLSSSHDMGSKPFVQTPIAIVGMACRLPGRCATPDDFWNFMMKGGVAANTPPPNRFNLAGHFDASRKPQTMKTPGAMFMEDVDPADFDAQFFSINNSDAIAMDPQQRNLMEVTYECLENAGMPMEKLSGKRVGCLVGASAVDYYDMDLKDVEDRTDSPTIGSSRSLLGNRISHFLNVHGPSMSVDTACSSALTALDMACLYLGNNQADAMFVGGVNMYLSPERNEDPGNMRAAASPTGRCHVFDSKADGYVAAEAINVVFLKRLQDAVRDGDPIRAVIRGTSTNSAGRTPGISQPNPKAQADAIRDAYANAGFHEADLVDTGYLECHGTGTIAGDPIEIEGLSTIFAPSRSKDQPLAIGSVKGNVGHSEAASGLTSVIKVVLSIENGKIPGTATFLDPNPRINFESSKVKAFYESINWPLNTKRRASINSFGFGGANAHAILESPEYLTGNSLPKYKSSYVKTETIDDDFFSFDDSAPNKKQSKPKLIVLSANDEAALKSSMSRLASHLLHPAVNVELDDLAYTLSERRSRLYHRAYSIQKDTRLSPASFVTGKTFNRNVNIGLVFTGQGAQWPTMGKDLIQTFPAARRMVEALDGVLMSLPDPPKWTLMSKLVDEKDAVVLRDPEFSQPIVTALQLAYLEVLSDWGIKPAAVAGHSSGEIAASVAAGYITAEAAIKIAFFRGRAIKELRAGKKLGMLAAGISADAVQEYIDSSDDLVQVACVNSPRSVTLSGTALALERVMERLQSKDHFARMLQVDFAYHSDYMSDIAIRYAELLAAHVQIKAPRHRNVKIFSSVTGDLLTEPVDLAYWVQNLQSQVRFQQAVGAMIDGKDGVNFMIEVGPSNALAGPVSQICESASHLTLQPHYTSVSKRGSDTLMALYGVAGNLFTVGGTVNLERVNELHNSSPSTLIDLPNYAWNRSKKYWHESLASKDWRFRPFVKHDLLGTKIPGTSWQSPVWRNKLKLANNTWLNDHKLSNNTVFPGTGYICMAMEAMYQTTYMTTWKGDAPQSYTYRLRDIKFLKALFLDESDDAPLVVLTLTPPVGSNPSWFQFKITAEKLGVWNDHATGFIRIDSDFTVKGAEKAALKPFDYPMSNGNWYKKMRDYGFNFGPSFQKIIAMESATSTRKGRSRVSLQPPTSTYTQSPYALHPACMDGCFQSVTATWDDNDSNNTDTLIPQQIDSLTVPFHSDHPEEGISVARSDFIGVGRREVMSNHAFSCAVYHPTGGDLLLDMKGIRYAKLGTSDVIAAPHKFCQLVWDADITLVDESGLQGLINETLTGSNREGVEQDLLVAQRLINLATHKNPQLNVVEFNLDLNDDSSLWFDNESSDSIIRSAFSQYTLALSSVDALVKAQQKYNTGSQTDYIVIDADQGLTPINTKFDLAIVKLPSTPSPMLDQLTLLQDWLKDTGITLFLDNACNLKSSQFSDNLSGVKTLWSSGSIALTRKELPTTSSPSQDLVILQFNSEHHHSIKDMFASSKWNVSIASDTASIPPGSKVVVLDELQKSVMTNLDKQQWDTLQYLVEKECHILWVTAGGQGSVTDPDKALINGFFRTLRNETPFLTLLNLDVENASGEGTIRAITKCVDFFRDTEKKNHTDNEYTERNGVLRINRVLPDVVLNKSHEEDSAGRPPEMIPFQSTPGTIKLRAERVGNLDSLQYSEVSVESPPLPGDWVEIEIMASGVNFKDVASVIGLVPENEHLLGGEGSGVIRQVGSSMKDFIKGQRVAFFKRGSFGNRVQASSKVVHAIPDSMTFEEAATLPCAFATSIYALIHMARIKKGDRVLIHSATGGVGISAIQICQYFGAEVYATCGTQEKRDFLTSQHGVPDENIFNSRNSQFAEKILDKTDGYGVDIILNSLAGDLLDESWRIIATGGTMVEIGKKDILDRNVLSMEPFNRNASFKALDLSHEQITDDMLSGLLNETFDLFQQGHIKPISPTRVFPFDQIPSALRLMRSGKHIGKLIISRAEDPDFEVSVRRAPRSIKVRDDVCYLIVGGLRGLCSTLAISLAKNGAKHLAVLSRSAQNDERSRLAMARVRGLGCEVSMIRGDITNVDDVRAAFKATTAPIAGIIQGAMVLNDRPFSSMTINEYHATLQSKVRGTWNLHQVSLEQDLSLEFFTLLSSVSGLYGSLGQANYAAANTFLDAFASYRRGLGLPAISINLGVVANVGYLAEHDDLMNRYDEAVWQPVTESVLRDTLKLSLQQQEILPVNAQSASHMITGLRVPQPSASQLSRDARFAGLFSLDHAADSPDASAEGTKDLESIRAVIRSKAGAKVILDKTAEAMSKYFMRILRVTDALDFARPLSAYGIDSLAAVEVRNFLKVELSVELTTLEIINATSLLFICERIIEEVSRLA